MLTQPRNHAAANTDAPASPPVWVLVPTTPLADDHLQHYGDFEQGREEFRRAFDALGLPWHWQPVSMSSIESTVQQMVRAEVTCVINLCDGDELHGVPGLSVIDALDRAGLAYTGSDRPFFDLTTSKIDMKRAFEDAGVPTSPWSIVEPMQADWHAPFQRQGRPLIVKPAVSAGSLGISVENVVHTPDQLEQRVKLLADGYRGWDLAAGGLIAEEFVAGREYTTFIVGDHNDPRHRRVYPPIERVFNRALPPTEQFLSFDRLWEFYDHEAPLPEGQYLWEYARAPAARRAAIKAVSWDAYVAVGGVGYGRVDLREDAETGELYVLEVNAQCGLSEDENYTSIGAILRMAGVTYHALVAQLMRHAERRHRRQQRARRIELGVVRRVA
jgi:D-alanine-D-alanine ligase